jgi:Cu(I)/Ag(I) efflux system membrane fusion protein
MKNILKNNKTLLVIALIAGIVIGKLFTWNSANTDTNNKTVTHNHNENKTEEEKIIWTCSMHPQIRMDKPGKCPICGMDLIPLNKSKTSEKKDKTDPNEISMSKEAMKLAEIQTLKVSRSKPEKEIRLLGKIKPDERLFYTQAAHFPGRIEDLYANFTGKKIAKGQKIAKIYSPELITAQKELFESIKSKNTYPLLYKSTRNKLKLWKLTDEQIDAIEANGEIIEKLDVLSDYNGVIINRKVELGDHVKEGQALFELADLSHVWVMFEAYESDLPWLNINDKVTFTVQGLGNKLFNGKITYINPFVDAKTRVAEVRVELNNPGLKLLPEMYANGIVKANLKGIENSIVIPKSAVLWTGKRAIVYVKIPNREMPTFLYREIVLGEDLGEFYVVKDGLNEGEEIAVNGVFRIDASTQLEGKKSMMNPTGGSKKTTGHNHAGMKME